jgi:hypothetical protein
LNGHLDCLLQAGLVTIVDTKVADWGEEEVSFGQQWSWYSSVKELV